MDVDIKGKGGIFVGVTNNKLLIYASEIDIKNWLYAGVLLYIVTYVKLGHENFEILPHIITNREKPKLA